MNNRHKKSMSARVKLSGSKRYSSLEVGDRSLPECIDAPDFPINEWLEELINTEHQEKWITDKLDVLKIDYKEELAPFSTKNIAEEGPGHATSLTVLPFLDMKFLDDRDKPIIIFAISITQISVVVQMLLLAEKLKRTDEYVNVIIIFINSENLEYSAQHLQDWLEDQKWAESVVGTVSLAGYYGSSICINNRHDNPLSVVWHRLMQEYQLDWAVEDDKVISPLYQTDADSIENYNFVSIGFGPSASLSDDELKELLKPNQQMAFAKTGEFYKCNDMLYQSVILLSDYYKK